MLHWIYYQDFVIDYWYLARYLTRSLLGYLQDLTSFFPLEHKKIFKYFCISVNISVLAYDSHRICFTVLSVVVHLVLNSHHDIKKENKQNIIFYSVPENWHLAFYWAAESSENSPSLKQASHFLVPWWLCVVPNLPLTRCDQLIGNVLFQNWALFIWSFDFHGAGPRTWATGKILFDFYECSLASFPL